MTRTENETSQVDCYACEDTGYEPGCGLYCTFCKRGYDVATRQMALGLNPWGDEPSEPEGDE